MTTGQMLKQLCGIMKPDKGAIKRVWGKAPVEFIIGIDKDHTAYITMDQDDYLALLNLPTDRNQCEWTPEDYDDMSMFYTGCGKVIDYEENPKEYISYCHHCGGKIDWLDKEVSK